MGKPAPFLLLISARPYLVQAQSGPPVREIPERPISDSPPDQDHKISVDAFQSARKQGFKQDVPKVQEKSQPMRRRCRVGSANGYSVMKWRRTAPPSRLLSRIGAFVGRAL